jgi:hypothetical protein
MVKESTNRETHILKMLYSEDLGLGEIQKILPNNRTISAINSKALSLKIKRKRNVWTREEINLLCEYYPSATRQEIIVKCRFHHRYSFKYASFFLMTSSIMLFAGPPITFLLFTHSSREIA